MKRVLVLLVALSASQLGAGEIIDRADPSRWILWRCGPVPFPTTMWPTVPETLAAGPATEFGDMGSNLCVVLPDGLGEDYAGKALRRMAELVQDKGRNARIVTAGQLEPSERKHHLLLLGTLKTNPIAREALGDGAAEYMKGIPAGGYRIGVRPSPYADGRQIILALGADADGAWAAAAVMAFSVRPKKDRLTAVRGFPVKAPEGMSWAPFEASYTGRRDAVMLPPMPSPAPRPPRVQFGMRLWGSPMPTLDSYQRLIRALKPLGVNTIVIQPGGWPDLPDAAERCRQAIEIAYREGIFTVLYAGNEMKGHFPAPLTENHRAIVAACDSHPGLLGWHLYNQLSSNLTAEQRRLVEEQTRWLRGLTKKTVAQEIVWGHDATAIPSDKVRLIRDCKAWGMNVLASDYAPIGGWSKDGDLSRWEGRFLNLRPFGLPAEAVLQAHVPFLDPTLPTAAEVRNQFWWALAGGARAFYFEAACLYTHFSFRGILSWDLKPLPDGRYDEIRELARTAARLENVITASEPMVPAEAVAAGFKIDPPDATVALRVRQAKDGRRWLLLINRALDTAATVTVRLAAGSPGYRLVELYPASFEHPQTAARRLTVGVPPGGGACLELVPR